MERQKIMRAKLWELLENNGDDEQMMKTTKNNANDTQTVKLLTNNEK